MFTDCLHLKKKCNLWCISRLLPLRYFKLIKDTLFSWFQLETAWQYFVSLKKSVCFGFFFLQKCNKAWTKLNTTSYSNWNKSVNELLWNSPLPKLTCINSRYRDVTRVLGFFSRCHNIFYKKTMWLTFKTHSYWMWYVAFGIYCPRNNGDCID